MNTCLDLSTFTGIFLIAFAVILFVALTAKGEDIEND